MLPLMYTLTNEEIKQIYKQNKMTRQVGRHHSGTGHDDKKHEDLNFIPIAEAKAGKNKQIKCSSMLANLGDVSWPSEYP